jgi:putative flippase GtrA
MIKIYWSGQFVLFVLTGGVAAAVNFSCRIVYNRWVDFSSAIVFAYLTGMASAFLLGKFFVFKGGIQPIPRSFLIFSLVNLVAVFQTWLVSMGLANYVLPWLRVTKFIPEIAHGIGVLIPVFTSYVGHKRWSFK